MRFKPISAARQGVETLMAAAEEQFDRLDIVVNNASVFQMRDLLDVSLEDWDLTMAVNLRAPFLITQRAARIMAHNPIPGGVIVNICDAGVDGPWRKVSPSRHQQIRPLDADAGQRAVAGPRDSRECDRAGTSHEVRRALHH